MDADLQILMENNNFTLNSEISGPALAVTVAVQFILSLIFNLFVLIFTLCHPKTLKQPSIIFLTNYILVNLMVTIMVMPFTIITASKGEWVFGSSVKGKYNFCQFTAFVFAVGIQMVLQSLAAISVDRFLFIVKPLIYKRYMKTWVAAVTVIIMWIFAALVDIPPFFGQGRYGFGQSAGICVHIWGSHFDYYAYFSLIFLIIILVITITSLWTFCFTKKFIKKTSGPQATAGIETAAAGAIVTALISIDEDSIAKHIYTNRMRKLIGIFGAMIIFLIISFIPVIVVAIAGVVAGVDSLPHPVISAGFVSLNVNFVANPIIQSYFRKDLKEFIIHLYKKMWSDNE